MGGRPPKPTKLLELSGALRKNPQRAAARAAEPVVDGSLGDPPAHWTVPEGHYRHTRYEERKAIWAEFAEIGTWLTVADRGAFETYCTLKWEERNGTIKSSDRKDMIKLGNLLGFDPSGRSRIHAGPVAPKKASEDPRDAFMQRARHG